MRRMQAMAVLVLGLSMPGFASAQERIIERTVALGPGGCVPGRTLHLQRAANGSQKRLIFRAIVGAGAAEPRELNCKLVLVTHH